jgi:plasmid stabilization system protein ParE
MDDDKLDELAEEIDEARTGVDELAEQPSAGLDRATIRELREALEKAGDALDELEDDAEND